MKEFIDYQSIYVTSFAAVVKNNFDRVFSTVNQQFALSNRANENSLESSQQNTRNTFRNQPEITEKNILKVLQECDTRAE